MNQNTNIVFLTFSQGDLVPIDALQALAKPLNTFDLQEEIFLQQIL